MTEIKTLTEYANDILLHKNDPHLLADIHLELAAKYAMISDIVKDLDIEKAVFEDKTKYSGDKPLSDKAVNSKWKITEGGIKEIRLDRELEALEKLMSAIKSSIVVSSVEAKNQF